MTIGQSSRLAIVAVPAAGITYALFLGMNTMISRDYVRPPAQETFTLDRLTPMKDDPDNPTKTIVKPEPIETAQKPPPPPKFQKTITSDAFPAARPIAGPVTQMPPVEKINLSRIPAVAGNREASPLRTPMPVYPQRALTLGKEGNCEVKFNVDIKGKPFDVRPSCSDPIFSKAAKRAVQRSEFVPKIEDGQRAVLINVVYPLEFTLK